MIRSAVLRHVRMKMKRPFGHARATRSEADSVFLSVDLAGVMGHGEAVPREYVTGETVGSAIEALSSADLAGIGRRLSSGSFEEAVASVEALALPRALARGPASSNAAACALELALLDAAGKRSGRRLSELAAALGLPQPLRHPAPVAFHPVARVIDTTQDPAALLRDGPGPRHVKIKVGLGREVDVARVRAAREALGPGPTLSVDANMAWSLPEALEMARALGPSGVDWIEEPLPPRQWAALRRLRRDTGARVMLDESLCSPEDARAAIGEEACDLFNLRISKCGGLIASMRLAELAHRSGLGFQLGAQVGELGPLWAAGRQFVSAIRGAVAYEAGQADLLFDASVVTPRHRVDRARWVAPELDGPGLGIEVADEIAGFEVARREWAPGACVA
ncbi:MAG TPA: enolase C-terminal domain-like protein [Myxococcaceae bacterium]|jgi:L-alanine-DL-glutamate epimerase-like enolase superfamily enzyme